MRRRLLASCLVLTALVACEGQRRSEPAAGAPAHEEARSGPAVAVLDISDGAPEEAPSGLLGLPSRGATLEDVSHEVDRIERDEHVRGVLVRLGSARIGLARSQEIAAMLAGLGAHLPVWCHAEDLHNGTLLLAARGCKRTWIAPAGTVDAVGLAAQTIYFHKLLAEEIGLEVDFLQIGKFKGAEEPFTRDGPSPEARASLEATLSDLRGAWLGGIREGRPAVAEATPEDGPYDAPDARQRGLVDDLGYFDEARDALEKESGAVRAVVRVGSGAQAGADNELSDLLRALAGESLGTAPVALVRAVGAISMEGGGGLLSEGGGVVEKRLARTLERLEKDDDVKAVVLRIDSPGGSALASDLLWHDLMRLRARKPLVVSVGGMAASGGYYLASTGAAIYADDTSILGSIGVVGGKIAADRALERIGVHAETIPAKVGDARAASRAAFESLLTPWDDATRERMRTTMTGIYDLFLARVAEGRQMPVDKVAASAEGRLFGGRDAKARGLVDEIGGLHDALARARALAGLPDDARVTVVGEGGGILDVLGEDTQGRATMPAAAGAELARREPDLLPFLASLAPVLDGEHALCAVPFGVAVR